MGDLGDDNPKRAYKMGVSAKGYHFLVYDYRGYHGALEVVLGTLFNSLDTLWNIPGMFVYSPIDVVVHRDEGVVWNLHVELPGKLPTEPAA